MAHGRAALRVGVDIGGTFTDLVAATADGAVHTAKVLSTPEDFARGILDGLRLLLARLGASPAAVGAVLHATTVATNAILEDKGARTALVTTRGFRDVLELRRIRIPELYNFFLDKPRPMVPRRLRFEVTERLSARGEVRTPLDLDEVDAVLDRIAQAGVESVAICLLHSYADARHEQMVAARAAARLPRGTFVTWSAELVPEIREYERTSTVVINAAVGPIVRDYLSNLTTQLGAAGVAGPLQVMMSNGGLMSADVAMRRPASIVESGPAAGVIAAAYLARTCGLRNAITLDMGGTTAKAGLIEDGAVTRTTEYEVGAGINVSSRLIKGRGHALKMPVIDLSEIGAGGGSIARVDSAGRLTVGPDSAGARPGPVCYDRGGIEPTLTDAMVVLGYVNPVAIAGGSMRIVADKARAAVADRIAGPLRKTPEEAAYGIFLLACMAMTRAVKAVSTYRGRDPRDFDLIAFGGNGPLVAAQIAGELSMRRILVPHDAGVFSAFGLLVGNAEHDLSQALMRRTSTLNAAELAAAFDALDRRMSDLLIADGHRPGDATLRRLAELRYAGQAYELTVPVPPGPVTDDTVQGMVAGFHREHERTYGHCSQSEPVDLVGLRLQAVVPPASESAYGRAQVERDGGGGERQPATRAAWFGPSVGRMTAQVVTRDALCGSPVAGPAIVEEYDCTCLVPPGWTAALDDWRNIVLERAP